MLFTTLLACGVSTLQVDLPAADTAAVDSGETDTADTGDTGTDTGDTGTEEVCEEYPNVPLYDGSPAEGEPWRPRWMMPGFVAAVDDSELHDLVWNGSPVSSYFTVNVADEGGESWCAIYYDLSESVPAAQPWLTDTGGLLFDAWDLVLRDGYTDCPPIAANEWGVTDLRDLIEQHTWGWAFGESIRVAEYLAANTDDWEVFWEPHLVGGYVVSSAYGDDMAFEMAYAVGMEADCGVAVLDWNGEPTYVPAVDEGPMPAAIWQGASLYAMELEYLR